MIDRYYLKIITARPKQLVSEDGVHQRHHPNGVLSHEFSIKNGLHHGVEQEWHANGELALRRKWTNGKLNGLCKQWSQRGGLLGSFRMTDGTGKQIKWHENGAIENELDLVGGVLNGLMRIWSPDGVLIGQKFYFDGRAISKRKYDLLCRQHLHLPKYGSVRVKNTLGRWWSGVREQRAADADRQEQARTDFDDQCESERKEADAIDVERWLKKRRVCSLGDMETSAVRRWIKKLKTNGACRIWATRVQQDPDGSEHSNQLIVELPSDERRRKRVVDALLRQARPFFDGSPAVVAGNRFVTVSLV
jgi:hypothetical protein